MSKRKSIGLFKLIMGKYNYSEVQPNKPWPRPEEQTYSKECYDFYPACIDSLIVLVNSLGANDLKCGIINLLELEKDEPYKYVTSNVTKFLSKTANSVIQEIIK